MICRYLEVGAEVGSVTTDPVPTTMTIVVITLLAIRASDPIQSIGEDTPTHHQVPAEGAPVQPPNPPPRSITPGIDPLKHRDPALQGTLPHREIPPKKQLWPVGRDQDPHWPMSQWSTQWDIMTTTEWAPQQDLGPNHLPHPNLVAIQICQIGMSRE